MKRPALLAFICSWSLGAPIIAQQKTVEVRAATIGLLSRRNATFAGLASKATGTHLGGELHVEWRSILGVTARVFGGSFDADSFILVPNMPEPQPQNEAVGTVRNGSVELFGGPPHLRGSVGIGLRSFRGSFGNQQWSFVRLGAGSSLALAEGSDFRVSLGVALYVGVIGGAGGSGREGETRVTYTPTRFLPRVTYLFLGYRFEQFTANAPDEGGRPEEIGSVIFGAGIRFNAIGR